MNILTMWLVLSRLWILARVLIRAATIVLGAAVLVSAVDHFRNVDAELVIHVPESNVLLTVGDQSFRIQGVEFRPIVCEVAPGSHLLTLSRDDRVLYEETVEVGPGEYRVCTAYDVERYRNRQFISKHARSLRKTPDRTR